MAEPPIIHVLAGVNGAGKSSIGQSEFNRKDAPVFNPDTVAQQIRNLHPDIPLATANAHSWQIGKALLEQAIAGGRDYRFETTLGGRSIAQLLEKAARAVDPSQNMNDRQLRHFFYSAGQPKRQPLQVPQEWH